jgi:hypothetical protein
MGTYVIEIKYSNSKAGNFQVFYDYGNGYSEENSFRTTLDIVSEKTTIRIPVVNWQNEEKICFNKNRPA